MLEGMLLSPAPDLTYVVGLPFGLLVFCLLVGTGLWVALGRLRRS